MPAATELPAPILARQLDLQAAWERVHGKRGMPGVDGMSTGWAARRIETFLVDLRERLGAGGYVALPLRLAEIQKKSGAARMLLVPTVEDRIAQTAVAAWLGRRWNSEFDAASFAYRPGLGAGDALRALAGWRDKGYRWILDADIRSFFDSIPAANLVAALEARLGASSAMLGWIRNWLGAGVWDGVRVTRLAKGVPQGSPLSPLLANFYLDPFDRQLRAAGIPLVRYADDFVALARTPFALAEIRAEVERILASLGLELAPAKTRHTSFDEGFRFLGARVQGDSILLPFDVKKQPGHPSFVAPVMPRALISAWKAGTLAPRAEFVWEPHEAAQTKEKEKPASRSERTLALLRKRPGSTGISL